MASHPNSHASFPEGSSSSSSSSVVHERKYEVFLSFRGQDTRRGFLGHLREALSRKKIVYFVDDQNLPQGDEISPALLAAIEQSEISLVIFSENYASSTWCLKELAHIMECKERHKQTVIPVFYEIDPSNVRHQKRSYQEAFAAHEKRPDEQKWRDALKKAADLSGFHSENYKTDAELVEKIVQRVSEELYQTTDQSDTKRLVGIDEHIAKLESMLHTNSQDILIIGIWGMGGIGKTTIAETLFHKFCSEFEGSHCLHLWKEIKKDGKGLQEHEMRMLKSKLLSRLLKEEDLGIDRDVGIPPNVKSRLGRKKILVLLDDIEDFMQLQYLTGGRDWFGSGSRIILTSRNKIEQCDKIYEVKPLKSEDALQLFNMHAFGKGCLERENECYKLSREVINYAKNIPLVLKVLGSSLWGKGTNEWKSLLGELEKKPNRKIQEVLEISYDGLDHSAKDIFLYLACFFCPRVYKVRVTSLLGPCDYSLKVLHVRTLISISNEGEISMHDLIRDMGREIVNRKSCDPGERNHLWNINDICEVFEEESGTREIKSISLDLNRLEKDLHLTSDAFSKMKNLRLLEFRYDGWSQPSKIYFPDEGFRSFSYKLRCIRWDFCTSKSLPLGSRWENLVELNMRESNLRRLWEGTQKFPKLKIIDLCESKELVEFPSLSDVPNLETINLEGCRSLVELNLMGCDKREDAGTGHNSSASFTSEISEEHVYSGLRSLTNLYLENCYSLTELKLGHLPSLEDLNLAGTEVETLPTSIQYSSRLKMLDVHNCSKLRSLLELPTSIVSLKAFGCSSLETPFPSLQYNLVDPTLSQRTLRRPRDIGMQEFPELKYLRLSSPVIKFLDLSTAPNLESVYLTGCISLVELNLMGCDKLEDVGSGHISSASITSEISEEHVYSGLRSLKWLNLFACRSLTELKLGHLPSLGELILDSTNVETLPTSIKQSSQLRRLIVANCKRLQSLQELPLSIEEFSASNCPSLEILSPSLQYYNLVRLTMRHKNLGRFFWDGVQECPKLKWIDLSYSKEVTEFLDLLNAPNLEDVDLSGTDVETLPTIIKRSSQLWRLHVEHCGRLRSLQELPSSIVYFDATDCPSLKTVQFNSLPPSPHAFQGNEQFFYEFEDCLELDEQAIEAIFKHYFGIASAGEYSELTCTGSKVPECLGDYRTTQDSVLVTLELPPHSRLKGFIFYFVLIPQRQKLPSDLVQIVMRISRNGPEYSLGFFLKDYKWDHVHMFYNPISHETWEWEEERLKWEEIFKSRDSANDQFAKVWFEIYRKPTPPECIDSIKEWGVCPVYN